LARPETTDTNAANLLDQELSAHKEDFPEEYLEFQEEPTAHDQDKPIAEDEAVQEQFDG
jgi:hypothetical protein